MTNLLNTSSFSSEAKKYTTVLCSSLWRQSSSVEIDEMMMGHGSCGYGGGSSPSPSNLSALAPPFTVDRSVPKPGSNPLVDLTEPAYAVTFNPSLQNWLGPHPPNSRPDYFSISNPEFDSVPSSNAYRFSSSNAHVPAFDASVSASTDTILYGQGSTSLLEAKPYYPSYVSPTICSDGPLGLSHHSGYDLLTTSHVATSNGSSHDDYTQNLSGLEHVAQWGGLWEGLADWQQSEQVQLDASFCPNEKFINQGLYASDGMSKYEEASCSIDTVGGENHIESAGIGPLDYFAKFEPTDYPATSSSASTLVPENFPLRAPSLKAVNSWNHQMPYSASHEKCFRKHDASLSDISKVKNSAPTVVIRPPDTSSFRNMNNSSDEDNKDFASNNLSCVKEPHPFISSECNVCFDASQVRFQLEQNDQVISEFSSAKKEELSSNRSFSVETSDHLSWEKYGIQVPHRSPDGFNLVIDKNESINPIKNYSESFDHYNSAVDSPCWKGAPVSHFSESEVSDVVTSQKMKKLEACCGSNLQGHQIFSLNANDAAKISPEKFSESSVQHDGWAMESCLAASLKRPLVANLLHSEGIDDAVKSGPHDTNPSSFHGVQISDDALPNKAIDNSDHKSPYNDQKCCEEVKWTSEKNCAPRGHVADFGMNMNDDADDCSSHVPFHAIEHVLRSPPSADDAPAKLTKSHGGESTQKMYVRTLIDTIMNLSELLVFHFSNDTCEMKEDDYEALKDVINNLDLCVLKNVERMTSTQNSVIPRRVNSQLGKSSKLQKVSRIDPPNSQGSVKYQRVQEEEHNIVSEKNDEKLSTFVYARTGAQVSRIDPPNSQGPAKYQHVHEEEHNIGSGKNDEKLSNFVFARTAADILKDENMTQAIKKALSENFHGKEESDPQVILYKNLWLEAEASLCTASCMARFNQMKSEMEKLNSQKVCENTVVMEKPSGSKVSSDLFTYKMLASDSKGSPFADTSIRESSILSPSSHTDDVTARFHILKCRIDNSNTWNTSGEDKTLGSAEKKSSSDVSPNSNDVDKLGCEDTDGHKPDVSIQDSSISSTISPADDVEASVMARFHILQCRVDNLNSMDKEEHQRASDDLGLGNAGFHRHWPIDQDGSLDRILDVNMEPQSQNNACMSTEDKSTIKEFHLFVKDDPITQSRMTSRLGDQSHAGSSDWEHVLLEELAGQNC
ncbi:uncharacterized protein LOC110656432 isoform X3 [Hevea brasiliensis]|uniref:uncharacterized protein LOC110656432 isoform X3 n=1 Tax=Hevea brasiliensis TaxID=3981 RepID=UPI0025FFE27F|nr:uncharacterized protein LOC110656432 isoform X3 [Hevea brasiliensis]